MTARTTPPFRADVVGSLLRPPALLEARERWKAGELPNAELRALEDAAITDAVKLQEDAGLLAVTDGEFRRDMWHMDFLLGFGNTERTETDIKTRFHSEDGMTEFAPPGVRVAGALEHPADGIFVEDFAFLKSVARATPKQTIPSPTVMHFRGGRGAIDEAAYPTMEEFYADLARQYRAEIAGFAAAGCTYLQLDEVNYAFMCDPALSAEIYAYIGEDPAVLPHTYAKLINDSLAEVPETMTVSVHLCRGNAFSNWMAEGGYDPVAEIIFNELDVDAYFLEYDSPRAGGFEPLRFLPKGKFVVLGLVTTKHGRLEEKDDLKRRIDEAAKFAPLDQLCLSPQCGFASGAAGNKLSLDDEKAKLALVVETAEEVWG